MKRFVLVVLLGGMLLSSAYAAEQSAALVTGAPQQNKVQDKVTAVSQESPTAKKIVVRKKVKKPVAAETPDVQKQDSMIANPVDSTEQSVQLRGVRG